MTEFCAAIGQNSLKNLDFENRYRNNNVSYLLKIFPFSKYFKIIEPQKGCSTTYHKLPLIYEYKNFNKNINFFIKFMNNYGIPFSHAYTPLNHHSNFNIKKEKTKVFLILIFNLKSKNILKILMKFAIESLQNYQFIDL